MTRKDYPGRPPSRGAKPANRTHRRKAGAVAPADTEPVVLTTGVRVAIGVAAASIVVPVVLAWYAGSHCQELGCLEVPLFLFFDVAAVALTLALALWRRRAVFVAALAGVTAGQVLTRGSRRFASGAGMDDAYALDVLAPVASLPGRLLGLRDMSGVWGAATEYAIWVATMALMGGAAWTVASRKRRNGQG